MKRKSFLGIVLAVAMSALAFAGCTPTPTPPPTPDTPVPMGWYTLVQKTVAGTDVTSTFIANAINLKADGTVKTHEASYTGLETTDGTWTFDETESVLSIKFGLKTYEYGWDEGAKLLAYSGRINKQQVVMNYVYDEDFAITSNANAGVAFTDELFGESLDENFYNYCPTAMMEGNNVMHVWYCTNKLSGNVTDYVGYRKGVLNDQGKWVFSEKTIVLEPTTNTWDSRHVCDPSVVKGSFNMGGENYSYLMAYLGCVTSDNTCNEVGIAVAKAPEGPWVKVDSLNPIANFYESPVDYDPTMWGYGQPCVISSDKAGKIFLIYTKGVKSGTYAYLEEWDLSNIDQAVKVREVALATKGVVNASGGADCINNADFAYDPVLKRLYCLKEDFPYPDSGGVNWLTGANTLLYVDLSAGIDKLFDTVNKPQWIKIGTVTSEAVGVHRAHNMGILTTEYGEVIDPYNIPVIYTRSDAKTDHPDWNKGGQWPALHTYRLYGTVVEVK